MITEKANTRARALLEPISHIFSDALISAHKSLVEEHARLQSIALQADIKHAALQEQVGVLREELRVARAERDVAQQARERMQHDKDGVAEGVKTYKESMSQLWKDGAFEVSKKWSRMKNISTMRNE